MNALRIAGHSSLTLRRSPILALSALSVFSVISTTSATGTIHPVPVTPPKRAFSPPRLFSSSSHRAFPAASAPSSTMKALLYLDSTKGPVLQDVPRAQVEQPSDAVVRMQKTTICGTDLHILKGDVAAVQTGRVLGHEGVGVVEAVGAGVTNIKPGDRVLVSCISSCSKCHYCRRGLFSHCTTGGWLLGNTIDGTQADYVRIPHADTSLYVLPPDTSDADAAALVLLSDTFPTGFELGVQNAHVEPGASVVIVGAGPIGLAALITAQLYAPATLIVVDMDDNRLRIARELGATHTVNNGGRDLAATLEAVRALTPNGVGCDSVVEAVGVPASFELCQRLVAPGGTLSNVGVHGTGVTLHLDEIWDQNISINMALVNTTTLPLLLKLVQSKRLNPAQLITHKFKFSEMPKAYETFQNAAKTNTLKVLVEMD